MIHVIFGALLLIIALFLCILIYKLDEENVLLPGAALGGCVVVFILGGTFILDNHFCPAIKPIDVYQGKTTLKYTVIDGVKVDSCIIWKETE